MVTDDRCWRCGARLFGGPWCGQCGAKPEAAAPVVTSPTAFVPHPVAALRYTRWQATPTTFGGPVKVLFTVLLVTFPLLPALLAMSGGMGADPLMIAGDGGGWLVIGIVLRSLWRRGQIPVGS